MERAPESRENGFEVGYGKVRLKAVGRDVAAILLLVLAIALIVYSLIERRGEHETITDEMAITNWLLSKPEKERPELIMPRGARDRLKNKEWGKK